MPRTVEDPNEKTSLLQRFHAWKLTDAKAHFSELVRQAFKEPQRVTVDGEDAVMVVSTETFSELLPAAQQPSLHELLSNSPLKDLEFEHPEERSPVRDVQL